MSAPIQPIRSVEQDHPWLWIAYAASGAIVLALSAWAPSLFPLAI